MRHIIFGAGAIGGAIGGRRAGSGADVALIARGKNGRALRERGLVLTTPDGSATHRLPVVGSPAELEFRDGDIVYLTMKSQDTQAALRALADVAPDTLPVVCAQNGVENERAALRSFSNVHAMCVMLPATHLEPGVVVANGAPMTGILDIGRYPAGTDASDEAISHALRAAHFASDPVDDAMRRKYGKLLINLANALEAACGPSARESDLARRAKDEAIAVFEAAGIAYTSADEDRARRGSLMHVQPIDGASRQGGSSWQSLARGAGSIEADYLNGEIALLARTFRIAAPVNVALQRLANRMVLEHKEPGSMRLEDVEALVSSTI